MTQTRSLQLPDYVVSDEAAADIAEVLMDIALQFEATHLAQIRRHYKSIMPERDDNQLDLFDKNPPFGDARQINEKLFLEMPAQGAEIKAAAARRR